VSRATNPGGAVEAFGQLLASRGLAAAELLPGHALQLWLDFASTPFDVPAQPQADGLLYQWGTYDFTGQPLFHIDLVRQFALFDDDEYAQFHLDVRLPVAPELTTLGSHSEWWWSDGGVPLDAWRRRLVARPEWVVLASRSPSAVEVFVDHT
jgi:hypothetical protein